MSKSIHKNGDIDEIANYLVNEGESLWYLSNYREVELLKIVTEWKLYSFISFSHLSRYLLKQYQQADKKINLKPYAYF